MKQVQKVKPGPHFWDYLSTKFVFCGIAASSHVSDENDHRKRISQILNLY